MVRRLLARLRGPPPAPPPAPARWAGLLLPAVDGDPRPLEVEEPLPGSLLLDIREPGEFAGGVAPGAMLLPMNLVPHHLDELPTDRPITVYCAAGSRSLGVASWLRDRGFDAVSLAPGIGAFRTRVPVEGAGRRMRLDGRAGGVPAQEEVEVIAIVDGRILAVGLDGDGFAVRIEAPAGGGR